MLFLRYYFWIAPHILLGIVLAGLFRRQLQRQLPIFLSYLVFELGQFLALLTINLSPAFSERQYQWALAFGLGVGALLKLGVIYELTNELLLSRSPLVPVLRPVLRWVAALLLLAAASASAGLLELGPERVRNISRVVDLSWSVVLSGLLVVLFAFTRVFTISWRSCTAGIALGFGVFSTVELATSSLRAELGLRGNIAISVIQMAGYHACVLVWLIYVFLPERTPKFAGNGLHRPELEFWDQELQRMVRR